MLRAVSYPQDVFPAASSLADIFLLYESLLAQPLDAQLSTHYPLVRLLRLLPLPPLSTSFRKIMHASGSHATCASGAAASAVNQFLQMRFFNYKSIFD